VPLLEEALAITRSLGDVHGVAVCLVNLGDQVLATGDLERASFPLAECLELCRKTRNQSVLIVALYTLGDLARAHGDVTAASAHYRESLGLCAKTADPHSTAYSLQGLAALASMRGDGHGAAVLYAAAEALRERISSPMAPNQRGEHDPVIAEVRQAMGEAAFARAWSLGRSLSPEQAVAAAGLDAGGPDGTQA
jgi:hypothetical protein